MTPTPEQIAASLTPAEVRALQGKRGYTDWLRHASSVRLSVQERIIRKGLWETFRPEPHGLLCVRTTPIGLAVLAALDKGAGE